MFLNFSVYKKLHASTGIIDLDVKISANEGEIISIFGKSGAGKTTVLRILAGLTQADSGSISVGDEMWFSSKTKSNFPTKNRSTGFVFQDYALFPNMNVRENLEFAYNDKKKVDELLDFVKLTNLQKRMPTTLSGGQKQRVALARALVKKPKLLLLDEPLSALDIEMRHELQDLILKINKELNITTIIVSHDLAEIFKLTEKVYIIDEGKIINYGEPSKVFVSESFSAKFQFIGEILEIKKADMLYIVVVLVGNNVIRVVATKDEISNFEIGEKIIVGSKAFNPILQKMDQGKFRKRIKNIWFQKKEPIK